MRIITGDECGILKECLPERTLLAKKRPNTTATASSNDQKTVPLSQAQRIDDGVPCRARGVMGLVRIDVPNEKDNSFSFATLRMNGSVELWDSTKSSLPNDFGKYQRRVTLDDVFTKTRNAAEAVPNDSKLLRHTTTLPLGLVALPYQHRLCVCDQAANVVILKFEPNDETDSLPTKHLSIVQHWHAYGHENSSNKIETSKSKALGPIASAMTLSSVENETPSYLALGGREHDVRLLDLETGKMAWKAKNVPPHPQTLLQQPIWPTSLLFLSSQNQQQSQHILAVGTAYHQVRLYDVRCSSTENTTAPSFQQPRRRPFSSTPTEGGVLNHRITSMVQTSEHHLIVGDTVGDLHSLDIRTFGSGANTTTTPSTTLKRKGGNNDQSNPTGASSGRYVGPMGSVRQLDYIGDHHRLAVVGLDRMLRIYNTKSRKQLHCVYLKQRLNCVLFTPQAPSRHDSGEDEQQFDADDGDMDQEDQVQDYLNSSEEEGDDSDQDDESSDEEDDDDDVQEADNRERNDDDDDFHVETDDDNTVEDGVDDDDDADSSSDDKPRVKQVNKRRKR